MHWDKNCKARRKKLHWLLKKKEIDINLSRQAENTHVLDEFFYLVHYMCISRLDNISFGIFFLAFFGLD